MYSDVKGFAEPWLCVALPAFKDEDYFQDSNIMCCFEESIVKEGVHGHERH